jgi:hypothetical protein
MTRRPRPDALQSLYLHSQIEMLGEKAIAEQRDILSRFNAKFDVYE